MRFPKAMCPPRSIFQRASTLACWLVPLIAAIGLLDAVASPQPSASVRSSDRKAELGASSAPNQTPANGRPFSFAARPTKIKPESLYAEVRSISDAEGQAAEPLLSGETLPRLLRRLDLREHDIQKVLEQLTAHDDDAQPAVGSTVRVTYGRSRLSVFQLAAGGYDRPMQRLEYFTEDRKLVRISSEYDTLTLQISPVGVRVRYVSAAGVINRTLASSAGSAGIPRDLMIKFADVFAFDVDFARQIYRGDRFEVVYEQLLDGEGEVVGVGDIVFAALSWLGGSEAETYYRFAPGVQTEASYFSDEAKNPRTLLMRSPINGARVTSRFGPRRSPIDGFTATHKGIDFGAAIGTPVLAAGDGTVEIAGTRGTFGNYIRIAHANGYATAYAHLHGFAPTISEGAVVTQGQVIGYVGTTGRSTGPHLHYEVMYEGVQQNPETVSVAVGQQLVGEDARAFAQYKERVDSLRITPYAVAQSSPSAASQ